MRNDAYAGHGGSLARGTFIAALAFVAYASSLRAPPAPDANDHIYLADSFLRYGVVDLTRYRSEPSVFFGFASGEQVFSAYTSGAALLFTPFAGLAIALGWEPGSFLTVGMLARAAAALWVSVAVAAMYLTLRALVAERAALLLTFALAFGTAAHSIASQMYFQHGPSLGLLALAVLAIVRGGERWTAVAGLPLATACIVRQQDALIALPILLFVLDRRREHALRFALWGVAPLLFQAAYGLAVSGNPLPLPPSMQRAGDPLVGLPGLFVSPNRGLLIGSPFLAFGLAALAASWRWRGTDMVALARYGSVGVAATAILFASVGDWWGGHTYGDRYLLDALPLYAVGLGLAWMRGWLRPPALRIAFVAAVLWSVAFHTVGAAAYHTPEGRLWNALPEIDAHPERAWSWTDPQWLAVLRAGLGGHLAVLLVHASIVAASAGALAWSVRTADRRRQVP